MRHRRVTSPFIGILHRSPRSWRAAVGLVACIFMLTTVHALAATLQDSAAAATSESTSAATENDPEADSNGYTPPAQSHRLDAHAPVRPLLAAVRAAAAAFDAREWPTTSTQELGLSTFGRFNRLFEKERIQRATDGFLEGYVQVFVDLPEAITIIVLDMKDEQAASDYYLMDVGSVQISLDGINQNEDGRAEVTLEEDIILANLDQGFDKRWEVSIGDLPPSRFRVMFGRTGHHTLLVQFLQSDVTDDAARELLRLLTEQVNNLAAPGATASR